MSCHDTSNGAIKDNISWSNLQSVTLLPAWLLAYPIHLAGFIFSANPAVGSGPTKQLQISVPAPAVHSQCRWGGFDGHIDIMEPILQHIRVTNPHLYLKGENKGIKLKIKKGYAFRLVRTQVVPCDTCTLSQCSTLAKYYCLTQ